ncbi:MAG: rod shape-determining protein [Clostridia bacterium]|nr:rod shape-determining protein [Clostridia bacterium]
MKKFKFAIEMGGSSTCIYVKGEGLALKEATLIAAEPTDDGYKVIALGNDAKKLVGKTKENVEIFTPCASGEHSHFEYSVVLLKHFLGKVGFRAHEDNALFVVPCGLTAREKENILNVCDAVGLASVVLIPSVLCSCVGEGRNIDSSKVNMIVDIGGTATEIGVINMSSIIKGATVGIGGKSIDASIVNFLAYTQDFVIGLPTAEMLKNEVGSLYTNETLNMEITGVDAKTKTPKSVVILSSDLRKAIEPFYSEIVRAIDTTINTLAPEIVADIINNKILLLGGCAKLQGLENYLKQHLGYPVEMSQDVDNVTILGAGKLLSDQQLLESIIKKL